MYRSLRHFAIKGVSLDMIAGYEEECVTFEAEFRSGLLFV